MVSLPLQLCSFSDTFTLKTFLEEKNRAAAHGENGSHRLGTMPEGAAVLLFILCVHSTIQGKTEAEATGKSPNFLHPEEPNGWKPETSGETLAVAYPTLLLLLE